MFAQASNTLRSHGGRRLIRLAPAVQRRNMGGGGAFMETNKFGETVGDAFGTIAWLWVFHRFRHDGAVLLGFQHPWEHGHDDHAPSFSLNSKPVVDVKETWEKFSDRAVVPGEDDDDDDDDEDDDDDDDDGDE